VTADRGFDPDHTLAVPKRWLKVSPDRRAGMTESDHENGDATDAGSATERSTAPQSEYTGTDVALGATIALVGILVTVGIPLAVLL
jgi:hypothetical protein